VFVKKCFPDFFASEELRADLKNNRESLRSFELDEFGSGSKIIIAGPRRIHLTMEGSGKRKSSRTPQNQSPFKSKHSKSTSSSGGAG
jgi:hypothetical protein